jgi:hypothetical protein
MFLIAKYGEIILWVIATSVTLQIWKRKRNILSPCMHVKWICCKWSSISSLILIIWFKLLKNWLSIFQVCQRKHGKMVINHPTIYGENQRQIVWFKYWVLWGLANFFFFIFSFYKNDTQPMTIFFYYNLNLVVDWWVAWGRCK